MHTVRASAFRGTTLNRRDTGPPNSRSPPRLQLGGDQNMVLSGRSFTRKAAWQSLFLRRTWMAARPWRILIHCPQEHNFIQLPGKSSPYLLKVSLLVSYIAHQFQPYQYSH